MKQLYSGAVRSYQSGIADHVRLKPLSTWNHERTLLAGEDGIAYRAGRLDAERGQVAPEGRIPLDTWQAVLASATVRDISPTPSYL